MSTAVLIDTAFAVWDSVNHYKTWKDYKSKGVKLKTKKKPTRKDVGFYDSKGCAAAIEQIKKAQAKYEKAAAEKYKEPPTDCHDLFRKMSDAEKRYGPDSVEFGKALFLYWNSLLLQIKVLKKEKKEYEYRFSKVHTIRANAVLIREYAKAVHNVFLKLVELLPSGGDKSTFFKLTLQVEQFKAAVGNIIPTLDKAAASLGRQIGEIDGLITGYEDSVKSISSWKTSPPSSKALERHGKSLESMR